jgi:hypothetical protein
MIANLSRSTEYGTPEYSEYSEVLLNSTSSCYSIPPPPGVPEVYWEYIPSALLYHERMVFKIERPRDPHFCRSEFRRADIITNGINKNEKDSTALPAFVDGGGSFAVRLGSKGGFFTSAS